MYQLSFYLVNILSNIPINDHKNATICIPFFFRLPVPFSFSSFLTLPCAPSPPPFCRWWLNQCPMSPFSPNPSKIVALCPCTRTSPVKVRIASITRLASLLVIRLRDDKHRHHHHYYNYHR